MVKIFMPLKSIRAHGWLGKDTYKRRGVVTQPYPIGRYGLGLNTSQYYSPLGWCYQVRRTWHGMQNTAFRPPISEQPKSFDQVSHQEVFADAVEIWQGMSQGTKDYYHNLSYPVKASGYNRFIRLYLNEKYPMLHTFPVYRCHWVRAGAIKAPGIKPASFEDLGIAGVWQFSDGAEEKVFNEFKLSSDLDKTKELEVILAWSSPAVDKACRWQVEYRLIKEDDDVSAAAQATLTQNETSSSNANGCVRSSFLIPAESLEDTDCYLLVRLSRLGNHVDDTLEDVASLMGMGMRYTAYRLGKPTGA